MPAGGCIQRGGQGAQNDSDIGNGLPEARHALTNTIADLAGGGARIAQIVDALEPDYRGHAGHADHVALKPGQCRDAAQPFFQGRSVGRAEDLIAADALIDHRDFVAKFCVKPPREHVGPAVMAVDGRARTIGYGIAKGDDDARLGCHIHIHGIEKIPRCGGGGKRSFVFVMAQRARIVVGQVGRLQRLGMIGHRPAFTGNMKAYGERPAGQQGIVGIGDKIQSDGVAHHMGAGLDGNARRAAKMDGAVGAGQNGAAHDVQSHIRAVEGDGTRPVRIGEANAGLRTPDIRPYDHAK